MKVLGSKSSFIALDGSVPGKLFWEMKQSICPLVKLSWVLGALCGPACASGPPALRGAPRMDGEQWEACQAAPGVPEPGGGHPVWTCVHPGAIPQHYSLLLSTPHPAARRHRASEMHAKKCPIWCRWWVDHRVLPADTGPEGRPRWTRHSSAQGLMAWQASLVGGGGWRLGCGIKLSYSSFSPPSSHWLDRILLVEVMAQQSTGKPKSVPDFQRSNVY